MRGFYKCVYLVGGSEDEDESEGEGEAGSEGAVHAETITPNI
jgi:hypothetical protein